MAGPPVYAAPTVAHGITTSNTLVFTKPAGLEVGDVLVVTLRAANVTTAVTAPAGWIIPVGLPASDRSQAIAYKPIPDDAALAAEAGVSNYTFGGWATAGRVVGDIGILRGVDLSSPIVGTAPYTNGAMPAFTTSGTPYTVLVLFADERIAGQSHVPSVAPAGFTLSRNAQHTLNSITAGSRTAIWTGTLAVPKGGTTSVASASITWAGGTTAPRVMAVAFRGLNSEGAGAVAAPAATASGTGNVSAPGVNGAGTAQAPAATGSGAATLRLTGSGSASPAPATGSGALSLSLAASGSVSAQTPGASGSAVLRVTGLGAVAAQPATGTGSSGAAPITGAGSASSSSATGSGSAIIRVLAAGAVQAPSPSAAGASAIRIPAVGSVSAQKSTATGQTLLRLTGFGSSTAQPALGSSAGTLTLTGFGTASSQPAYVSGAGTVVDLTGDPLTSFELLGSATHAPTVASAGDELTFTSRGGGYSLTAGSHDFAFIASQEGLA